MIFDSLQLQLCDIQGRLFKLSLSEGFASEVFIKSYMKSQCAADYGLKYNRLQWAGEEYILEELIDECKDKLTLGEQYSKDEMFWIGYTYSYWHILTGESSKKILSQVPARMMRSSYAGLHTVDMVLAIEDFKQPAAKKRINGKPK